MVQVSLVASILPMLALALPANGMPKFWARGLCFWSFTAASGPGQALLDALPLAACQGDSDMWGKARVFGAIGWGMMHLLLGPLID
eukprot:2275124-Amphidinium_carterae.1